ncbi:MAG TPA: DNA mismatch repair protein MutS, partial [Anaerolineaceae bacterium]|nr:DNA mismatch repair protein MutS [Anaerolineaceae bacterium]
MPQDITPLRQQYLDIKKQYPDAILFFRLGDFYETFDDDARKASEALDIVLTSRPVAKGVRVPMAGIPFHAADNYLGRLIEKGYRVAIAEQVGGQPDKGLFTREVVRVVTPGTVVEPGLLSAGRNNYLAAVCLQENRAGIAYLDITTGEFTGTQIELEEGLSAVRAEIIRINPAETLRSDALELPNGFPGTVTPVPSWYFEAGRAEEQLKSVFGVASLDGFGLKSMPLTARAAGALLKYLQETHKEALMTLKSFGTYSLGDFMVLDAETRRNLELTETLRDAKGEGSLLWVLDQTKTPMGKRMLRQWVNKPLLNLDAITQRLDLVENFYLNGVLRNELIHVLSAFHDLERLVNRVCSNSIRPPEMVSLREDLSLLSKVRALIPRQPALEPVLSGLREFPDVVNLLNEAIVDDPPATLSATGIIKPGFSSELDNIVTSSQHAREWINNLEGEEKKRTGIKTLKVGFNKVFGYYIEISRGSADNAPENYLR